MDGLLTFASKQRTDVSVVRCGDRAAGDNGGRDGRRGDADDDVAPSVAAARVLVGILTYDSTRGDFSAASLSCPLLPPSSASVCRSVSGARFTSVIIREIEPHTASTLIAGSALRSVGRS